VAFQPDLILRSQRVVTPGAIRPASIHIRGGKIVGVLGFDDVPAGCPVDDADPAAVIPGAVDTHVHANDTDSGAGDGLEVTTRAAAAGGITTLIVMPPRSTPPQRSVSRGFDTGEDVAAARAAMNGHCYVDVGLWGDITEGNTRECASMVAAGVFGFACCVEPSGGARVSEADLRVAMPEIARLRVPLLVHAEAPRPNHRAGERTADGHFARFLKDRRSRRSYMAYLESRPKEAENEAIASMIALCREFGTQIHIVHLSSADALTPLFHARSARLPITAETCPHYLCFVAEEIPDGGTVFKCAPPIRERENREFLWAAVAGGLIQMVVSDHSPAPRATAATRMSRGDFTRSWAGISSLQFSLPATWTGASARQYSLNQVTDWMCRNPAGLARLARKGAVEPGYDADLVVFAPDAEFTVDADTPHVDKRTPYVGRRLRGIVERTYLRGHRIYERGKGWGQPGGLVIAPGR
jgi:allantoinase